MCVVDSKQDDSPETDAAVDEDIDMGTPSGGSIAPDAMVDEADMEPSEPMPDAMVPDMAPPMPEADMGMPIAPECALSVATVLSREPRVEVTITVEDADTSLAALDIQLPGRVVDSADLDRNGQATITVDGLSEGSNTIELVVEDPNGLVCRVSENVVVDTERRHFRQTPSVHNRIWKAALQGASTSRVHRSCSKALSKMRTSTRMPRMP